MDTETIRLDATRLEFPRALEYEWLETNGLGGYAMGTPLFANTRKYHSLLACDHGGLGRHSYLAKVDVEIEIAGDRYELGTNIYPGAVHPRGFELATEFTSGIFPTTHFRAGNASIRQSVIMPQSENSVLLRFECDREISSLSLRPFVAYRDIHGLSRENDYADLSFRNYQGGFFVSPYAKMPALFFLLLDEVTVDHSPDCCAHGV